VGADQTGGREMNIHLLLADRKRYETNHILHLLLSLITVGTWIIPWIIVSSSNAIERGGINRKIEKLIKESSNH
jgi:hypothetical protein